MTDAQRDETLRNCVLRTAVAMATKAIPPQANTNDAQMQLNRSKVMQAMVMSEPHLTLNNQCPFGDGGGTLKFTDVASHLPFDASESVFRPNMGGGISRGMLSA